MALWHWLVGGAAAYMVLKPKTAVAAPGSTQTAVTPGQQVAEAQLSASIANWAGAGYSVGMRPENGGYVLLNPSGVVVVGGTGANDGYTTLDALFAAVKKAWPTPNTAAVQGWGYGYGRY